MLGIGKRATVLGAILALVWVVTSGPAVAVEDGLLGVRIGTSYRELTERFGPPDGILFPSGSGLIFQTVLPQVPQVGLPDFGAQGTAETPVWVIPIQTSGLVEMQSQWLYDLRDPRGVSLGIVLDGEGADAVVTDVVVAGFPKYLEGKGVPVRTQKGVRLQSTFTDVLKKYGYPPLIEIYAPVGARPGGRPATAGRMQAGVGGGAMRARGAGRAGARGRGGGRARGGPAMRGGRRRGAAPLEDMLTGDEAPLRMVLTGAPGRGGGRMRGAGGRGARMRGAGRRGGGGARGGGRALGGGGRRTLPPLGAGAAPAPGEELTASAVVEHQQISFSRDCIMVYEGISFTLHDMRVFRIHVSE